MHALNKPTATNKTHKYTHTYSAQRGRALAALLQPLVDQRRILLPASSPDVAATHGHWLFPVVILSAAAAPNLAPLIEEDEGEQQIAATLARVAAAMRRAGFDVTRGATQLCCVEVRM